jgi:hypothetical protein
MKLKVIIIVSIILFGLTACGGGNSNNQNTHIHDDGTVHEGHATTEQAVPGQESFKVSADSTMLKADSTKHGHGHDHSETGHKH